MTLTLSSVVLPTFSRGLDTLTHILKAAQEHAATNGIDADATYPNARLVEDMRPLTFQVQNSTRTVLRVVHRLQGTAEDTWEDNETTFADLYARIEKAQELIKKADAKAIDERAETEVEVPFGPQTFKFTAKDSALNQGIPNFFFHLQTAYAILRAQGVPIGKRDYISSFLGI
ncbi:protein of unknown function (DUF1993) domain containing protein [Naviculisporaceae sp. PSN 640]